MNCDDFLSQLDLWLDGECDPADAGRCAAHAAECPTCGEKLAAASLEAQRWQRALHVDDAVAARIAERLEQQIVGGHVAVEDRPAVADGKSIVQLPRMWPYLLWSAAAGFLLAVWLFGPRSRPIDAPIAARPAPAPAVARLTVATGEFDFFDPVQGDWQKISADKLGAFSCPSNSRLRTAASSQCELQTLDGGIVRLADSTEITLVNGNAIDVQCGQIWCRAPEEVPMEIRLTRSDGAGAAAPPPMAVMSCAADSQFFTVCTEPDMLRVINARGDVQLQSGGKTYRLAPGESADVKGGQVATKGQVRDLLLSSSWMQPLLACKGPDDSELSERVNAMLAQLGKTKMSMLYEREIRALGENAVLPLIRYVRSPLSQLDEPKRIMAMQLVSDLAPTWLIPDLIAVLEDSSPEVRHMAASALTRLTGESLGRSERHWLEGVDPAGVLAWRDWWQENKISYPVPTLRMP